MKNREMKFRAWVNVPNANTMLQNIDLEELWMSGRAYEDYGTSRYEAETISGISWTFKDLIFMQCTGLKDKNGVEIYEGDILDNSSGANAWVVEWGRLGDGDFETDCYGFLLPQGLEEWHIKGNIHEHAHLLNDTAS